MSEVLSAWVGPLLGSPLLGISGQLSPLQVAAVLTAVYGVAGLTKGVIGLGLPTIIVAVFSVIFGLELAVQLMLVPSLVTNLWQALDGDGTGQLLRRFGTLLVGSVVGTLIAFQFLFLVDPRAMSMLLGATLVVYASSGLAGVKGLGIRVEVRNRAREAIWSPAVGFMTGGLAGATGSMVLPVVPYLQSVGLRKDELVKMMGLSFTISTAAIALAVALAGAHDHAIIGSMAILSISCAGLLPALAGMQLGRVLRRRISDVHYRRALFILLMAIGIRLLFG